LNLFLVDARLSTFVLPIESDMITGDGLL